MMIDAAHVIFDYPGVRALNEVSFISDSTQPTIVTWLLFRRWQQYFQGIIVGTDPVNYVTR